MGKETPPKIVNSFEEVASVLHQTCQELPGSPGVGPIKVVGDRTPKASYTIMLSSGEILRVIVHRLTQGL